MPHAEHRQDRTLARRAARGDNAAWRTIYETTCQPLFNFLCYQVGERETAKDLLQDTYLSALGSLDRYRGEGSLLSWLRTIALRKCLDWRRSWWQRLTRAGRVGPLPEGLAASGSGRSDARLDVGSEAFRAALATLSPRQRAALLLRELEDLSYHEIAAALGCRETTARVHHHRGREKMKQMMTESAAPAVAEDMGGQQA